MPFFIIHRRIAIFIGLFHFFFELGIFLTGNFGFFNILIFIVNLSNFDDDFNRMFIPESVIQFLDLNPEYEKNSKKPQNKLCYILKEGSLFVFFLSLFCYAFYLYLPIKALFNEKIKATNGIYLNKIFNNKVMDTYFLSVFVIISLRYLYYNFEFLFSKKKVEDTPKKTSSTLLSNVFNMFSRMLTLKIRILFFLFFIYYYLSATFVFYQSVELGINYPLVKKYAEIARKKLSVFHVNNDYGLFRVMTGVGGRPELEIKVKYQQSNIWDTIDFRYKVSSQLEKKPKFAIPHQPRIDWQIWFSALSFSACLAN